MRVINRLDHAVVRGRLRLDRLLLRCSCASLSNEHSRREATSNVPQVLLSIGQQFLLCSVPIHLSRQCMWKMCVHWPKTARRVSYVGETRRNTHSAGSHLPASCTPGSIPRKRPCISRTTPLPLTLLCHRLERRAGERVVPLRARWASDSSARPLQRDSDL